MVKTAHQHGFKPKCVVFDGWDSILANLKLLRTLTWNWLTRLKSNRLVNKNRAGSMQLDEPKITASGTEVWLKRYGLVKLFKIVAPDGDVSYWATNNLAMTELERLQLAEFSWQIEHYHRGSNNAPRSAGPAIRRAVTVLPRLVPRTEWKRSRLPCENRRRTIVVMPLSEGMNGYELSIDSNTNQNNSEELTS